jgi:multicomponent Na+:H+ antiporter subunit C
VNGQSLVLVTVVAGLYGVGVYLLLQRSLIRIVLGFILLGHAANLTLLLSGGPAGRAPLLEEAAPGTVADPLPQAMALTAIVITFGVTAFLFALAYRSWLIDGRDEVQDDVEDRRIGRLAGHPEDVDDAGDMEDGA